MTDDSIRKSPVHRMRRAPMAALDVCELDQQPRASAALDGPARSGALVPVVRTALSYGASFLRVYHRHELTVGGGLPDGPVLFVANHGFGGIVALNVFASLAALAEISPNRDVTILCHQLAWTLKVGMIVEAAGARPAEYTCATQAIELGNHVLVFPGGDVEQGKSFADRDKIFLPGAAALPDSPSTAGSRSCRWSPPAPGSRCWCFPTGIDWPGRCGSTGPCG